jgi:hypothetical protein
MVVKSIILRLLQILAGSFGLYFALMAGTFLLQMQMGLAQHYGLYSLVLWIVWAVLTFTIKRVDVELVREAAIVVYPTGALVALAGAVMLAFRLEAMVETPERQRWTIILAGVLIAIVMIIRCLDIPWLRNAEDLTSLKSRAEESNREKYGDLH